MFKYRINRHLWLCLLGCLFCAWSSERAWGQAPASRQAPRPVERPVPQPSLAPLAARPVAPLAARPVAPLAARPVVGLPARPGMRLRVVPGPQVDKQGRRFRHQRYRRLLKPSVLGRRFGGDTCKTFLRHTRARHCVELVTMGQGKWIFTYFGHNALRVVSRHSSRSEVYNFGTFSFAKPMHLLWNYLQFKLQYQLSTMSFRRTFYVYRYTDRTLQTQRLRLTPHETEALVRHLRWHYQPENRKYAYHHYTSNCSTKVRDALHKVLGPDFRKYAREKRGATYRSYVMKAMRANPFVMTMMDFGMGPPADRPLDWWAEMFLPHHLQAYLSAPIWQQKRGQPLVTKAITHYLRKERAPRAWSPVLIVWSFSLLWLLAGMLLYRKEALRWYLRSILFVFSILGLALLFMMVGTNFPEPPGNANVLWYHPFHLVVWWMLGRKRWARISWGKFVFVRWYFTAHAGAALLYLLLKSASLVPLQINTHYVCWALFVFGLGALRLWKQEEGWSSVGPNGLVDTGSLAFAADATPQRSIGPVSDGPEDNDGQDGDDGDDGGDGDGIPEMQPA